MPGYIVYDGVVMQGYNGMPERRTVATQQVWGLIEKKSWVTMRCIYCNDKWLNILYMGLLCIAL